MPRRQSLPVILLMCASASPAGIVYVNDDASGANDGSSWANARTSLQSAILNAAAGDTVVVAAGVYRPSVSTRTVSFTPRDGIPLLGGLAGTETSFDSTALAARDFAANTSYLSGDLAGNDGAGTQTDNAYHVVHVNQTALTAGATIDGFTIIGGNAASPLTGSDTACGGGIFVDGPAAGMVELRVSNCVIAGNRAAFGGGLAIRTSTTASIVNLELVNVAFTGNSANAGATSQGGALYLSNGGGAVSLWTERCTFDSNTAAGSMASDGGALFLHQAGGETAVAVSGSKFRSNSAVVTNGSFGGAVRLRCYADTLWAVFIGCEFFGNTADYRGGGVYQQTGRPGAPASPTTACLSTFTNCTFTENAPQAVRSVAYGGTTASTVRNSILYRNGASAVISEGGAAVTFSHSLTSAITAPDIDSGGNIAGNPRFTNGTAGDLTLTLLSPCLNAGAYDTTGLGLPAYDLKGDPRIYLDTIDMGAYEYYSNLPPVITTVTADIDTNLAVGVPWAATLHAVDPEGGSLQYGLEISPAAMTVQTLADSGLLNWTPAAGDTGTEWVYAVVRDTGLLYDTLVFRLHVVSGQSGVYGMPRALPRTTDVRLATNRGSVTRLTVALPLANATDDIRVTTFSPTGVRLQTTRFSFGCAGVHTRALATESLAAGTYLVVVAVGRRFTKVLRLTIG